MNSEHRVGVPQNVYSITFLPRGGGGSPKMITILLFLSGGSSPKMITVLHFEGGVPPNDYS